MSTNNKSIQILRGTTANSSNVVLQPGQPFYDKTDHSFKIGQTGGTTPVSGTPRITAGALQLDHALATNLSIYADDGNIIIKNTSSGKKIQLNSPTTEITGDLKPSATGKNIGASNNKFNNIYTSNLLSSSISTSTVVVGEYASISINTGDPDHPNLIIQTGGAEGDITLQSNRYINLNNPSIINSTLSVTGMSTLNGIDNGSDGISNAGAVNGVTTLTTSNTATIGGNIVPASSSAQGTGKLIGTTINRWNVVNANQINTQSIEGKNSTWEDEAWSISSDGVFMSSYTHGTPSGEQSRFNTDLGTIQLGNQGGIGYSSSDTGWGLCFWNASSDVDISGWITPYSTKQKKICIGNNISRFDSIYVDKIITRSQISNTGSWSYDSSTHRYTLTVNDPGFYCIEFGDYGTGASIIWNFFQIYLSDAFDFNGAKIKISDDSYAIPSGLTVTFSSSVVAQGLCYRIF